MIARSLRFAGAKDLLLLKTDCVVAGVHFAAEAKPRAVGWKAMARPLSDFAAMAGVPQFALVTFIAPAETSSAWATEVYRGLAKAARAFEVAIVGGETSSTSGPVAISVSLAGRVEKESLGFAQRRKSGRPTFRDRTIGRFDSRPASAFRSAHRRGALVDGTFPRFTP